MVSRIRRIVERGRRNNPKRSALQILKERCCELISLNYRNAVMSLKRDSTFISADTLSMCSLFPQRVLDIVIADLKPNSVLDVGCGSGRSLKYFLDKDVDALGIENSKMAISNSPVKEKILRHNLKKNLSLGKKFDLVWSFEVIEHIHPAFENRFLATLTNHSDQILISAARPGQGGHGHFNEREPEYWVNKFKKLGFEYDAVFSDKLRSTFDNHSENILFFRKAIDPD